MATEKAIIAALMEKAGDYIGKNNPIDEVLYGKNGIVDKIDDLNYNRANNIGDIRNEYYDLLTDTEWARFYSKLSQNGKLNSSIGDIFVWGENGIVIIAQKVKITGSTNDYQIIGYEFVKSAESMATSIQKYIDTNGGGYDAKQIAEIINSIG